MSPRYPHCPIAPGKGCQSCEDMAEIVKRERRAERRRNVTALTVLAALGFGVVIALSVLL